MEKEGSFEFSVGTRVLVLGCYAGIVVSADAPVFVIRLTQYWSMTPCEALPEAAYQWLRANAIECDCMTSVNYPASMPYTVELCNSYEKLWRVGTQGVQVIPSDAPSYRQVLRWHFRVLLEQWECDTVRHRHDKNAELGYFYGHTDEQNIYFGHTGRCRVHYEYNPESYPSVNVRGQDKFSETLPEPGDVIYCGYVFKNRPCWFLARDYPGLHEMLTWLRTATGKKVPKFDWVSVYLSEHVSKTLTWRYLMERN